MQQLANLAAQRLGVETALILSSVNEREQLGSTGFGQGVAIPHGKIEGLSRIYGLFARLGEAVDYKAIDGRPVDLVFLLLSPLDAGAEHLKALAAISRVTRNAATLEKMRGARSRDALAAVLMGAATGSRPISKPRASCAAPRPPAILPRSSAKVTPNVGRCSS
jgi:PTS system nitrogen regulatory IIA component